MLRRGQDDLRMLVARVIDGERIAARPACRGSSAPFGREMAVRRPRDAAAGPALGAGGRGRSSARRQGTARQRLPRGAARQDHARAAARRARRPARRPAHAVLRLRRRDAAVAAAGRRARRCGPATSTGSSCGARPSTPRSAWIDGPRRPRRRRVRRVRAPLARRPAQPGLARRAATRCCTPTAPRPRAPSPWPRRRATCTTPSAASPPSTASSATWSAPSASRRRPRASSARFNERFWMEDEGFFAMALDGAEAPGARRSARPIGHALWSRIVADEHVADRGAAPHGAGHVHRLGRAHAQQGDARLQPGELLQRQRVAVRHRASSRTA